jgi:hypothetical protein
MEREKEEEEADGRKKKKPKGVWYRIWKTVKKCCKRLKQRAAPAVRQEGIRKDNDNATGLSGTTAAGDGADKDTKEGKLGTKSGSVSNMNGKIPSSSGGGGNKVGPSDVLAEEKEKAEQRLKAIDKKKHELRLRQEAEEQRQQMEAEAARQAKEEEEQRQQASTLNVQTYKSLWSSLGPAGSFQCKLKTTPQLLALSDHLRKQGFHVVFAASASPSECEIGICNVRDPDAAAGHKDTAPGISVGTSAGGTECWFLARFVVAQGNFSAVMKCEVPSDVPIYVKRFALAKVLKIDTTASPATATTSPNNNSNGS